MQSHNCEAGLSDSKNCASPKVVESSKKAISYPATLTNYKTFDGDELKFNNNSGTCRQVFTNPRNIFSTKL